MWMFVLAADEPKSQTVLDYVHAGGLIGYFIIFLSLVGLALVIANFIRLRRDRFLPEGVIAGLEQKLAGNDISGAIVFCRQPESESYIARVVGSALLRCSRSPFGLLELRSAIEESGQMEVERLYRTTDGIGVIAAVAPMLGLLGTVIGLVGAFNSVGVEEGARRSSELATYMSLALVTTAQGLFVAIPCTAAYSFFRRRIDKLASDSGDTLETLLAIVQSAGSGGPARGAPVAQARAQAANIVAGPAGGQPGAAARPMQAQPQSQPQNAIPLTSGPIASVGPAGGVRP
jgi:biopolymer transport protein ExbB